MTGRPSDERRKNAIAHVRHGWLVQIGMYGQSKNALRQILRNGQTGAVVMFAIGRLQMQRARVVHRPLAAMPARDRVSPHP